MEAEDFGLVDPELWDALVALVSVARSGDADSWATALRSFDRRFPEDGRPGGYLWYLLRYAVAERLRRRPSAADLSALVREAWPRIQGLLTAEDVVLEVAEGVFGYRKISEPSGGKLIVGATALLAGLLTEPQAQLGEMRPHLEAWWAENADSFRALMPPPIE